MLDTQSIVNLIKYAENKYTDYFLKYQKKGNISQYRKQIHSQ